MVTAVFPGSFDPFTRGHVDIATRALTWCDRLVVVVAHNSAKATLFDAKRRVELAAASLAGIGHVEVIAWEGLLVEACRSVGAGVIVKGLRGGADFDAELPMALMNRDLSGVETLFVPGDPALAHIASSLVKDVARHGGDVSSYVAAPVADALAEAFGHGRGA